MSTTARPAAPAPATQDWLSLALDQQGHWAWQWDASQDASRQRALSRCGEAACQVVFTLQSSCFAYAESRAGGYWYGAAYGASVAETAAAALGACGQGAPAGSCRLVRNHCEGQPDAAGAGPGRQASAGG